MSILRGAGTWAIAATLFTLVELFGAVDSCITAEPAAPVALKGHEKGVTTIVWSADGQTLATASDDRQVLFWNPATGETTRTMRDVAATGYGGPVVAFTSDLQLLAVNYWGDITIRSVADGRKIASIDPILDRGQRSAFRPDVYAMAFSPDGKRLASAGSTAAVGGRHGLPGGIVLAWDVATGKLVRKFGVLSTSPSSVAWSPDGTRLAVGTNGAGGELPEGGEVHVWNAESGELLHRLSAKSTVEPGEWASVADVAFTADGRHIAAPVTAGSRGTPAGLLIEDTGAAVRVWQLPTGESRLAVRGLKASVSRLTFSPDGKWLATAGADKTVRVWDWSNGKELGKLACQAPVQVVAFSPDGRLLAVGSRDGSARIWKWSDGATTARP